ncbi:MAG: Unknown protein [uncultured Sulfurovum sp.]|uniref:Uncharacterized protein n=1 Tax=uncultured Sulfurovum sp. TaxID=269237 RepID=A0A6S6RXS5_9BACT|nr:MAG: Unknown protein [uncultured Sulfurovum sp.]
MSKIKRILNILFEKKEITTSPKNHRKKEQELFKKKHRKNYLSVNELSQYFNISPNELNGIFQKLNWSKQEQKWYLMTDLGKYYGAKECYDNKHKIKYLRWNEKVKSSSQLLKAIDEFKKIKSKNFKEKLEL